jgi:hypothetical protein
MLRKCLSLGLIVALIHVASAAPVVAKSKAEKEAQFAEKVKAGILKLGTGKAARVKVKLRDKTKLEGFVGEAGADSFTVVDAKTGVATVVAYPQVAQAKGNNLSTGTKIAIGVAIVMLVVAVIYFASLNESFSGDP